MSGPATTRLNTGERLRLPAGAIAYVVSGTMNAAAVPFRGDAPDGPGLHVATLTEGDLAIGLPHGWLAIEFSARAASEVEVGTGIAGDRIDALDRWLRAVERIGASVPLAAPHALFPGQVALRTGETVAAPRERVVWVGDPGDWTVLADGDPRDWTVLTDGNPRDWPAEGEFEIVTTADLALSGDLGAALARWNDATATRLAGLAAREPERRARNIAAASDAVADAAAMARASIANLLTGRGARLNAATDPLARLVARSTAAVPHGAGVPEDAAVLHGAAVPDDAAAPDGTDLLDAASQAADRAGFGARTVAIDQPLDGEEGPKLLVEVGDAATPHLAVAQPSARGYAIFGPSISRPVPPRRVHLAARAVALTEPLSDRLIAALDKPARMLAASIAGSPMDTAVALAWGLAGIGTSIAMPAAVNLLFTSVWPRADVSGHWLVIGGLVTITLAGLGFETARSLRAGRLALRFAATFENGIWLRLVRARPRALPSSGGDTQERFATASHLRGLLGSQPMRFVTDLGMIGAGLAQMVYYGGNLAWIGVAAIALIAVCCTSLMPRAARARTETAELGGKQTALLAQAIAAVTKVKATASENFVLARWAALADRRRGALRRAERVETASSLIVAGVSGLATASVFALAGLALGADGAEFWLSAASPAVPSPGIALGAFIAFQVSLGQTMAAATSAAGMTALWPALAAAGKRLHPLSTLPPETVGQRTTPPPLEGAIAVSHVTHRYPGSDTPSLDDVSLTIAPREYVAIVGASGSGKSTLLRILLGLEQPDRGGVYFDGLDARQLDPAPLRRQIGYVGQDSRLAPGSILDNILDGRRAGAPAAWEAARLAGIAEDIEAMPMGMQTLVGEGGQNISGGQRQRILIARAVLSRPRIMIFDEATSALDNRTQAVVQHGLAELPVTRIVVAHRLSTIQGVDRVFVLAAGRVVESGSPAVLARQGGTFAALAGRQSFQEPARGDP